MKICISVTEYELQFMSPVCVLHLEMSFRFPEVRAMVMRIIHKDLNKRTGRRSSLLRLDFTKKAVYICRRHLAAVNKILCCSSGTTPCFRRSLLVLG